MKINSSAKKEKFRRIPPILRNITHFHENSWFSPNFAVLAPRRGPFAIVAVPHLLLKQKRYGFVTFFTFCGKWRFLAPKPVFTKIFVPGRKIAPGPPKTSPERYVYKGFCEGGAFGAQKPKTSSSASQNALLGAWTPRNPSCAQNVKYFLRNTNDSDMSKITKFLKFS